MTKYNINLLPGVAQSLSQLTETYKLVLITKGDPFTPKLKTGTIWLEHFFKDMHIVSVK